jgi:hypothetical protein
MGPPTAAGGVSGGSRIGGRRVLGGWGLVLGEHLVEAELITPGVGEITEGDHAFHLLERWLHNVMAVRLVRVTRGEVSERAGRTSGPR